MKSFKFRLQTVLEQRERQETLAKQSFAEADTMLRRGEALLAELRDVRAALLNELCARRDGDFDPMETQLYQEYMQTIAQSIREQEAYIRDLAGTREAHKLHLIGVTQNRQTLATVQERHKAAHIMDAQRREQSALDELSTTRYNHQRRLQD